MTVNAGDQPTTSAGSSLYMNVTMGVMSDEIMTTTVPRADLSREYAMLLTGLPHVQCLSQTP